MSFESAVAPTDATGAVTTGAEAHGAAWYVVYIKPHREGVAQWHLQRKGIEVFYPKLQLPSYAVKRQAIVPMFPNYMFVRIALAERFHDVVWTPGVSRFVGFAEGITPLGDDVVAFMKAHAGPEGVLVARSNLRVGQEVEITGGPFAGVLGLIQRPPDAKGRIKLLMRLLTQRAVTVDVPVRHVRSGWVV